MESSPSDLELQQLLSLLLRVVGPEVVTGTVVPGPDALDAGVLPKVPGPEKAGAGLAGAAARGPGVPPGVSASEARALTELLAARGIAQGQLAALLGLEKSTVSRLAVGLERKGWIRRGRDEENQRYLRLYLTPEGRALAGRVLRSWWSRQARVLSRLSPAERVGLAVGLRGLARSLVAEGLLAEVPSGPVPAGAGTAPTAAHHPPASGQHEPSQGEPAH